MRKAKTYAQRVRNIFRWLYSLLFLLVVVAVVVVLGLALLEPIYTPPWREWLPLLIVCLISGMVWTIFAVRSGKVERTTGKIFGAFAVNLFLIIFIAFIAITIISFFGWNGGAPLDDVEPINPADAQYP